MDFTQTSQPNRQAIRIAPLALEVVIWGDGAGEELKERLCTHTEMLWRIGCALGASEAITLIAADRRCDRRYIDFLPIGRCKYGVWGFVRMEIRTIGYRGNDLYLSFDRALEQAWHRHLDTQVRKLLSSDESRS